MAQLKAALEGAGISTAEDRLEEIALKAMVDNPGSLDATGNAIWTRVRKDRFLMDALLAPYQRQAISRLIDRVRDTLGYNPATGYGATQHIPSEQHHPLPGVVITPLKRRAQMVSTAWDREHKALLKKNKEADIQQLNEYRERRYGWLQTEAAHVQINDKPFWTVCVNEARRWIDRTKHEARFMELVISGVPDDGRPIEHYRRPEEIDALWKQAEAA